MTNDATIIWANINQVKELSVASHTMSGWHRKGTFDITEIANNHRLKRGIACPVVALISYSL